MSCSRTHPPTHRTREHTHTHSLKHIHTVLACGHGAWCSHALVVYMHRHHRHHACSPFIAMHMCSYCSLLTSVCVPLHVCAWFVVVLCCMCASCVECEPVCVTLYMYDTCITPTTTTTHHPSPITHHHHPPPTTGRYDASKDPTMTRILKMLGEA